MSDDPILLDEQRVSEEREAQSRRLRDRMLREPIRMLNPRMPPVCVSFGDNANHAIELMKENAVGHVLVTSDGVLKGIVTERDIVRKAAGFVAKTREILVESIMTSDPECLGLDDPILFALHRMGVHEYRHVPLVDSEMRPVGSISTRHVLRYLADLFADWVFNLPPTPESEIPSTREGA